MSVAYSNKGANTGNPWALCGLLLMPVFDKLPRNGRIQLPNILTGLSHDMVISQK
jgi:hypothetical protein